MQKIQNVALLEKWDLKTQNLCRNEFPRQIFYVVEDPVKIDYLMTLRKKC